jgi:hypothetical protein
MYLCSSDESGKTLAIIIGLVAAVAIVIVFLSFLRRAGAVGGKIYTSLKPRVSSMAFIFMSYYPKFLNHIHMYMCMHAGKS